MIMIKPYYKHEHTATMVEVEDFGIINLIDLPITIFPEKEGHYEIGWSRTRQDGKEFYTLSEYGGNNSWDFSGRSLGVIREIAGTQHMWAIKLLTDKFEELEEELSEEKLHCDEGHIDFSDDYFERSDYAKALKVAINQLSR